MMRATMLYLKYELPFTTQFESLPRALSMKLIMKMKPEAKENIRKALRDIDVASLKREVKEEAKSAVSEKLESSMMIFLNSSI